MVMMTAFFGQLVAMVSLVSNVLASSQHHQIFSSTDAIISSMTFAFVGGLIQTWYTDEMLEDRLKHEPISCWVHGPFRSLWASNKICSRINAIPTDSWKEE